MGITESSGYGTTGQILRRQKVAKSRDDLEWEWAGPSSTEFEGIRQDLGAGAVAQAIGHLPCSR